MTGTQNDSERGRRLAARRKELGLSQGAMAAKIGVHRNTLIGWEKGTLPQERWIPEALKHYGLPPDFFFSALSDFEARMQDEVAAIRAQLNELMSRLGDPESAREIAAEATDTLTRARQPTD